MGDAPPEPDPRPRPQLGWKVRVLVVAAALALIAAISYLFAPSELTPRELEIQRCMRTNDVSQEDCQETLSP
jgi:hypothetical protein